MLILNNANNSCLNISSYFPIENREIVLITTRNSKCKIYIIIELYKLDAITTNKAVTLLLKTIKTNNIFN